MVGVQIFCSSQFPDSFWVAPYSMFAWGF